MARLSLQTLEIVSQLQQRSGEAVQTFGGLPRLVPGQLMRVQVLQALGNDLFLLNVRGSEVVGSSSTGLTPGDVLTVQAATTADGQANIQLLSTRTGALADVAGRPDVTGLENQQPVDAQARILLLRESGLPAKAGAAATQATSPPPLAAETAAQAARGPLPAELAALIRPDGPVARLLAQRPDLAPRIEQLLSQLLDRPEGLGPQLQALADQLGVVSRSAGAGSPPNLEAAQGRLLGQLLSPELLDHPEQLAQALANRLAPLARGLESAISRLAGSGSPPPATAGQAASTAQAAHPTAGQSVLSNPLSSAPATLARGERPVPGGPIAGGAATSPGGTVAQGTPAASGSPAAQPGPTPIAAGNSPSVPTELTALRPPVAASQAPTGQAAVAPDAAGISQLVGERPVSVLAGAQSAPAASAPPPAEPEFAGTLVRGVFEGDLKGQLLELRTQLQGLATSQADPSPSLQQAIARVDLLMNQVAAQQVRNIDGLNQFLYVELPVHPRSGIEEARLQVFYRKRGRGEPMSNSERFTVAVFLTLSRLGEVLAVVTGLGEAVTVGFTVDDPLVEQLLVDQSDDLRDGLARAGHAGATVTVRRKPEPAPESPAANDDLWRLFLESQPTENRPGARLDAEV